MGSFSIWHILILAAVALVLFGGRGKVSDLMGDFGKGINSFQKGLRRTKEDPPSVINAEDTQRTSRRTRPTRAGERQPIPCSIFSAGAISSSCWSSRWSWSGRRICRA